METTPQQRRNRFNTVIDPDIVERVKQLVLGSRNTVITCHVSPDGDALGSSLALCSTLRTLGKNAVVVTADCPPKALQFMPGIRDIVTATRTPERAAELIADADLVFCLDFNDLKRVDRLCEKFEQSQARRNFSYNSNDPDLYLIVHDLLRKGIDKDNLYKLIHNNATQTSIRINGYAQYRTQYLCDGRVALITLSSEELKDFDYSKGDTEGLVNVPLSIPEVQWSIYLREDAKDYVKVSMRSKGSFPVNLVCEQNFSGGGHVNASGGEYHGSLSQAITYLLETIPQYENLLE